MSALLTQCPCSAVKTGTGKVDPDQKFNCTTAARGFDLSNNIENWLALVITHRIAGYIFACMLFEKENSTCLYFTVTNQIPCLNQGTNARKVNCGRVYSAYI